MENFQEIHFSYLDVDYVARFAVNGDIWQKLQNMPIDEIVKMNHQFLYEFGIDQNWTLDEIDSKLQQMNEGATQAELVLAN